MNPDTSRFLLACRGSIAIWVVLVLLVVATVAAAYAPFGPGIKTAINLAIVAAQVGPIAIVFMNLRGPRALPRFAAVAGVYWLTIMFVLTFNDYASRPASHPCADGAFVRPDAGLCRSSAP